MVKQGIHDGPMPSLPLASSAALAPGRLGRLHPHHCEEKLHHIARAIRAAPMSAVRRCPARIHAQPWTSKGTCGGSFAQQRSLHQSCGAVGGLGAGTSALG